MNLGRTCREWRGRKGMTQKELATALGVFQSQVSDFENGKSALPARAAFTLEELTKGQIRAREVLVRPTKRQKPTTAA